MENLVKRWNELETSNSHNILNKKVCDDIEINSNTNRPQTLDIDNNEKKKSMPHSKSAGSTISSSSPSSPPRYSDDITPSQPQATSMELISTVTTIKTTTTEKTILTEEANFHMNEEQEQVNKEIESSINDLTKRSSPPFRKTTSIDSIKSKTIVTPCELEPNNAEEYEAIAKELSIIKLTGTHMNNDMPNLASLLLNDDTHEANNRALLDITKSQVNYDNNHAYNNIDNDEETNRELTIMSNTTTTTNTSNDKITTTTNRDDIDLISNDLFDWLLWIDHTLESQLVTVGDLDEINQAIQKYDVNQKTIIWKIFVGHYF